MKERDLYAWLKRESKRLGVFYCRIENAAGSGTPDVWVAKNGRSGWVEVKCRTEPPTRENTPVFRNCGLNPCQIGFANELVKKAQVSVSVLWGCGHWMGICLADSSFNNRPLPDLLASSKWLDMKKSKWPSADGLFNEVLK